MATLTTQDRAGHDDGGERPVVGERRVAGELAGRPHEAAEDEQEVGDLVGGRPPLDHEVAEGAPGAIGGDPDHRREVLAGRQLGPDRVQQEDRREDRAEAVGHQAATPDFAVAKPHRAAERRRPTAGSRCSLVAQDPVRVVDRPADEAAMKTSRSRLDQPSAGASAKRRSVDLGGRVAGPEVEGRPGGRHPTRTSPRATPGRDGVDADVELGHLVARVPRRGLALREPAVATAGSPMLPSVSAACAGEDRGVEPDHLAADPARPERRQRPDPAGLGARR